MKKYYGKEKCRILKQIRAEIARENDIEWVVSECKHRGNCRGTCPRCEQEVRQLEEALARREALGKRVAVVGISAGIALSVTGCANPITATTDGVDPLPDNGNGGNPPVESDVVNGMMLPPESETMISEGEYLETDMGEPLIPGEVPDETTAESETEDETEDDSELVTDVLMGDPVLWDEGEP